MNRKWKIRQLKEVEVEVEVYKKQIGPRENSSTI